MKQIQDEPTTLPCWECLAGRTRKPGITRGQWEELYIGRRENPEAWLEATEVCRACGGTERIANPETKR